MPCDFLVLAERDVTVNPRQRSLEADVQHGLCTQVGEEIATDLFYFWRLCLKPVQRSLMNPQSI